ncbi:hypothetical protein [Cellulomonas sp. P5_C5]
MRFFHLADPASRALIERDGFSADTGSPSNPGFHMLLGNDPGRRAEMETYAGQGFLVVVEMPEEVARPYLWTQEPDSQLYEMPADVLNAYAPFSYIEV